MGGAPSREIEVTLSHLDGPGMIVKIVPPEGVAKIWCLPHALLSTHSGYFKRAARFKEGIDLHVELRDTEPHIFEHFIQFLYYGKYTDKDNLSNHTKIRDSAKAWVLGDYFDAPAFKRLAIRALCDIYLPDSKGAFPKSGFGPEAIYFCCENSTADSSLQQFYLTIAGLFWTHGKIVRFDAGNKQAWNVVWDVHPHFRNELFARLATHADRRLETEIPRIRALALAMEPERK